MRYTPRGRGVLSICIQRAINQNSRFFTSLVAPRNIIAMFHFLCAHEIVKLRARVTRFECWVQKSHSLQASNKSA